MSYLWIKSLHVIAVISWMAGLLYLYRLYVYHAAETSAEVMARLQVMERRLLSAIATPAMAVAVASGVTMLALQPALLRQPFMHIKLTLVAGMLVMHALGMHFRRRLRVDPHCRSHRFFRVLNEIPTLLMIGIVILIIVRPFAR